MKKGSDINYEELNKKLIMEYKNGNLDAKKELVEINIGLVKKFASKYSKGSIIPFDDLFQEGCLALMNAIDNYDISYESKFAVYAGEYIKGKIKCYKDSNEYSFSICRDTVSKLNTYMRFKNSNYTDEEIAKKRKMNIEQLKKFKEDFCNMRKSLSLDSVPVDNTNLKYTDIIVGLENLDETIDNIFREELLELLKEILTEKQLRIILLRYGFNEENREFSDRDIAKIVGTTYQNVAKIEKTAIKSLRYNSKVQKFCEGVW